jgi:DNA-binding beta-propeller fold protein YncE
VSVALASGDTFAAYRIESVVGRGGMGVVYRAADLRLERPVALKLVAPELAEDEVFRRRFLREPKLAAALDHPNVVPIYEAGEHEGRLYLAMRFVDGSDMRTLLRQEGGLPVDRSIAILEQVASALDAAHRRDLVHRDVKPANVLVDEDGHAYLTDFGVTKQLGGDSTDTGQIVGTLDYLAPEQIRGEGVSGAADEYALACVVYECVAGAPPFHRATEAETLWAHMQETVRPVPGRPALDPVLRKALAKEPGDRYGSCAELIEAARLALAGVRVPVRLVRRRWAIVAAGLLALAAVAWIALTRVDGSPPRAPAPPAGNGLARIASGGERIASFTPAGAPPSNIAVGEGSVWMLNTEDATVSRVDPRSGAVIRTFEPRRRPADVAAGAGALWIHSKPGRRTWLSRVDPATAEVTRTVQLPGGASGLATEGFPTVAVGAGGVWTINPDETVSRIDAASGRLVTTISSPAGASTISAGGEGVWVLGWENKLWRIDPRTNRFGDPIELGSNRLLGIAVGAGSVWATSEEGLLWRVEPGPRPFFRSIDVGAGVQYVAFGDGAVWTANWNDGTLSRVDPATNAVTGRVPVGAAQALAAGAGSAWVSIAGGARNGVLPASTCGEVAAGGRTPDVLVATDMPLRERGVTGPRAIADAVRFVIQDHDFRAGRYTVGYHSCDDSTAQTGGVEFRKCAANANAFASADRLVGVIGPYYSFCAQYEIPILNRAPGGPLALLGSTTTHPNLTRGGPLALPPPFGYRGEPDVYYPTGERNFFRLAARGDLAGVAMARLAKSLGLRSVYLLDDAPDGFGHVLFTDGFARAAPSLGLDIAGHARIDAEAAGYARLAGRVARSGADGVVLGDHLGAGGARLLEALRSRLGTRVTLLTGDGYAPIRRVREEAGRAADGLYIAMPVLLPAAPGLTPAARRFTREFGAAADEDGVLAAAQATETVLAAIARSDGTRASVLRELRATRATDGILGRFAFDRYGDITPARFTILRVTGEAASDQRLPGIKGAVVDRIIAVPTG